MNGVKGFKKEEKQDFDMPVKKGFRILEHLTMADTAFAAEGKSLNELFENAGHAVESIMVDAETVKNKTTTTITLEKDNIENLLYAFLSELVYVKDAEQLVFSEITVTITQNTGWLLHAHLKGEVIHSKMKLGTDIKAITLHKFFVSKTKTGWTAQVVVDV